jgi:hypothetical protein
MANANILQPSFFDLIGESRIGKQAACHADKVEASFTQVFLSKLGVESTGCPHRYRHALALDCFYKRHCGAPPLSTPIQISGQLSGGVGIEDAIRLNESAPVSVALGAAVDAVGHAGYQLCHPGSFVESSCQRVVVFHYVEKRVHGKGRPAAALGFRDNAPQKAGAVLEVLGAVLVFAPVPDA